MIERKLGVDPLRRPALPFCEWIGKSVLEGDLVLGAGQVQPWHNVVSWSSMLACIAREYTEEIERLRQDLVSAREKSGVYLSIENYNRMIAQMEQSEKEMSQKLSTIKLLNEQMEEKELICQQLNMRLERRTQRLQETHQTLCVTKRERDETAHLLERHMQTEEVLGDQARTLLSVADESSKDTYRLHDKLSRKRSVESENEDIIVNFHRNMNHDLSLLEGSLQQFTEVYHKYKSGLEFNLGDHLEDGVAHLTGLSNEMSTLVDSHNKILQQLKKGSSERVHDSKRMIQEQLASLRQTCDSESNKLHTFHVDSASPGIQNILYFLELQKTVTVALNQLSDNQLSLMMKLMEDHVSQVKQIVSSVKENHRALVASVKKREEDAHKFWEAAQDKDKRDTADLTSALTQQMAMLTQLMSSVNAKSDERAQMTKQAKEEDSGAGQTIEMLSNAIITDLDKSVLNEPDVVEIFSQESKEVFTGIEEAVERSSTYMSEAKRYLNDLKNEMVATLTSGETAWRKHYTHTEQDLRTHLERLGSGLQDELEFTAQLADVVRVCADNNEAALETRRHTLTTFVRERQNDIVAECSYVSDWTRRTVAEVQQRAQELDRFLTEDLRKDLPTGQTPKRKEFHYPHQLVATSPHDRILERFRARSEAMMGDTQPMLDLSLEESSISSTSDYSDDLLSAASTSRVEQEKLPAKAGPRKAASTNDVNLTGSSLDLNRSTVSEPELGKNYTTWDQTTNSVIGSPVFCKSSTLDSVTTEAGDMNSEAHIAPR
uniref:Kinesin-associated microtubule-binding domain-containing protein n=1 Tax=Timema genevievae TaxID=629358 RepID=A0A7R9JWV5_TIMGE|nr:unnamed protein product [Timema genevievae]